MHDRLDADASAVAAGKISGKSIHVGLIFHNETITVAVAQCLEENVLVDDFC